MNFRFLMTVTLGAMACMAGCRNAAPKLEAPVANESDQSGLPELDLTALASFSTQPATDNCENDCRKPTEAELVKIVQWIKDQAEYEWLTKYVIEGPCWKDGCFMRRIAWIKILLGIFSDEAKLKEILGEPLGKPICKNILSFLTIVYPQKCDWGYHTMPVIGVEGGKCAFDTYSKECGVVKPLEGLCHEVELKGGLDDGPPEIVCNESGPPIDKNGFYCRTDRYKFYVCPSETDPNWNRPLEDIKAGLLRYCQCSNARFAYCVATQGLPVDSPAFKNCIQSAHNCCKKGNITGLPPVKPAQSSRALMTAWLEALPLCPTGTSSPVPTGTAIPSSSPSPGPGGSCEEDATPGSSGPEGTPRPTCTQAPAL